MKRDQKTINERHEQILELLDKKKEVRVEELAELFDISLMTVRRDLQLLDDKGLLERFHGGARRIERKSIKSDLDLQHARDAISRYAATLLEDRDTLFINGSMTASGMLEYVTARNVRIYTNNAFAAGYITRKDIHIFLMGGELRNHIMVGDFCLRNLLSSHTKKAFLGCTGISLQGELMCDIPSELSINETMLSHADEYYILCDHTKLGKTEAAGSFSLPPSGTIITDAQADPEAIEKLREIGLNVLVAQ